MREFVEVGGLMSYESPVADLYHLFGTLAGKTLKRAKRAEILVQQSTKFELAINLKTAKRLGVTVATSLLPRADEGHRVKRRDFITVLAGATAWVSTARAQEPRRVIGVLGSVWYGAF